MSMVEQHKIKKLQEEVDELKIKVEQLEQMIVLMSKDLETIKFEGCWRFIEDPNHGHKK